MFFFEINKIVYIKFVLQIHLARFRERITTRRSEQGLVSIDGTLGLLVAVIDLRQVVVLGIISRTAIGVDSTDLTGCCVVQVSAQKGLRRVDSRLTHGRQQISSSLEHTLVSQRASWITGSQSIEKNVGIGLSRNYGNKLYPHAGARPSEVLHVSLESLLAGAVSAHKRRQKVRGRRSDVTKSTVWFEHVSECQPEVECAVGIGFHDQACLFDAHVIGISKVSETGSVKDNVELADTSSSQHILEQLQSETFGNVGRVVLYTSGSEFAQITNLVFGGSGEHDDSASTETLVEQSS